MSHHHTALLTAAGSLVGLAALATLAAPIPAFAAVTPADAARVPHHAAHFSRDPRAQLQADCPRGVLATMTNITGTRTVAFRLHRDGGGVRVVDVRAGQAIRRWFDVQPGQTATVSVTGRGVSARTLTWTSTCR